MTSLATQLLTVPEQQEPVVTAQMAALVLTAALQEVLAAFPEMAASEVSILQTDTPSILKAEKAMISLVIFSEICSAAVKRAAFQAVFTRTAVALTVFMAIAVLAQIHPAKKAVMHRRRSISVLMMQLLAQTV